MKIKMEINTQATFERSEWIGLTLRIRLDYTRLYSTIFRLYSVGQDHIKFNLTKLK